MPLYRTVNNFFIIMTINYNLMIRKRNAQKELLRNLKDVDNRISLVSLKIRWTNENMRCLY